MAMNSSKSMNLLRPHSGAPAPLQDRTSFYTNIQVGQVGMLGGGGQTQKNSTQNIHSLLKMEEHHTSHPLSQEKVKPRPQTSAIKSFKCCKEGEMLLSSDETANCSSCGLFFIFNKNGSIGRALREKGKEYALDFSISRILQNMKQKSHDTISLLNPHATYLARRKQLVDWISGVGESLQIASATIHHCVLMMDLYTSLQPNVPNHDLQLIAITCLMISTKFHEMKYPSASSLNSATRNAYTYETIISKEGEILATINWDLLRYTVLDYVHIFINQGCLFDSDTISSTNQQGKSQITKVITQQNSEYLRRYAEFFTDFCIQEEHFLYVNQLFLACAIIAFSRRYSRVSVIYPRELEIMTGVPLSLVKGLYQQLEQRYYDCFPDQKSQQLTQNQSLAGNQSLPTSEQSLGDRKQSATSKTSLQIFHNSGGSSTKKTQTTSNDKSSINNSGRPRLLIDVETPNKEAPFEFGTIVIKSNDKLSSQKTTASNNSNPKNRNPSQVAQLRLTTNPPDSVKKFAIKKSIIGALENAAHSNNLSMLQNIQENVHNNQQQVSSMTSRNKSAIGFGLNRITAHMKQSFNGSNHGHQAPSHSQDKHSSMDKKPSHQSSFVTLQAQNADHSMIQLPSQTGESSFSLSKKLQNSKSQANFIQQSISQRQQQQQMYPTADQTVIIGSYRPKSNTGSLNRAQAAQSAALHQVQLNAASKINNYLTIDVSGTTPTNGLSMPQNALQTINVGSSSANREILGASRIPKQKVLNIKIKENQFVPMTVTNKDRDSFKFSTTHLMQKMLNGSQAQNQSSSLHNTTSGSISTRNLSLSTLHQNKEAALGAQNQLILQKYHLRSNGHYEPGQPVPASHGGYNSNPHRPASSGYPLAHHQHRMNSSLNKAEIVKQLNVSRERLNSLLQNTTNPIQPTLSHQQSQVQLRGIIKKTGIQA